MTSPKVWSEESISGMNLCYLWPQCLTPSLWNNLNLHWEICSSIGYSLMGQFIKMFFLSSQRRVVRDSSQTNHTFESTGVDSCPTAPQQNLSMRFCSCYFSSCPLKLDSWTLLPLLKLSHIQNNVFSDWLDVNSS